VLVLIPVLVDFAGITLRNPECAALAPLGAGAAGGTGLLPVRAGSRSGKNGCGGAAKLQGDAILSDRMLNILLVEDDEVDVMNVQRAFKKNRIANPLFHAGNGLDALQMLRGGEIPRSNRLVLLDLNMPKMNGIEFLRALRADPELSMTSVVVLTTSNEDRDKIEAYKLNVAGYLLKPVTFTNFVDLMSTLNKYWTLVELP
jgi:CheY-like chemotaxis protein